MSGLRKNFGTNRSAVEEGAWIELFENPDGTTCRIRVKRMHTQNAKYTKELANHRDAFNGLKYSEKSIGQMTASMIEVLISTVIVDWENFEDWTQPETTDGFPTSDPSYLEFTQDNLRKTLIEFPDLVDVITEQAQSRKTFQGDDLKK